MTRVTQARNCPLCEAMCGLLVDADQGAGLAIGARGDGHHPLSRGRVCPKSQAILGLRTDPDRLRRPLRRTGRDFEEIGWDEAIAEACDRLNAIRKADGNDAVGFYFGNPLGHRPNLALYMAALAGALATRQTYWVGPIDQAPRLLSCLLMFGSSVYRPIPDIDRTMCMVIVGANPVVSNGSLVAPGFRRRLDALRSRGGKLIVIDPRRTETAGIADAHLAVRPGSDAALLLAVINVLFAEELVNLGACEGLVKGIGALRDAAAGMPIERTEQVTGIASGDIRELAHTIAAAPSAVVYGRLGACVQQFGSLTNWLMDCINILTGNLDRPGGAMFNHGVPLSTRVDVGTLPLGRWRSRVRGLPEFMGMMPSAVLAEELLARGRGAMRGFVILAGNPVLSNPNGRGIAEGLSRLDFLLSIDIYLNETSRLADLVLPSRDYLEESDYPASTSASMVRHYAKWSPPLFAAADDIPSDAELMVRLAAGLRGVSPDDVEEEMLVRMLDMARARGRPECRGMAEAEMRDALTAAPGGDRLFDIMLRAGPYGDAFGRVEGGLTLDMLKRHPHGIDFGPLQPELPGVLGTAAVIWSGRSLFCSVLRLIDNRSPLASKWAVRDVV